MSQGMSIFDHVTGTSDRKIKGSVRENPPGSGHWQVRFPGSWDPEGRNRRLPHPNNPFPTYEASLTALQEENLARAKGKVGATGRASTDAVDRGRGRPKKRTVQMMCSEYIEMRRSDPRGPLGGSTVPGYVRALDMQICDSEHGIGGLAPREVTAKTVEGWMTALAGDCLVHQDGRWHGKPLHPQSACDRAKALLSAAFGWEMGEDRVDRNPVTAYRPTIRGKNSRNAKPYRQNIILPTWREFATINAYPETVTDRLLLAVMGWCGLRWKEAASVQIGDLLRRTNEISVQRVYVRAEDRAQGKNVWREEPVKSGIPDTVPVPDLLMHALLTHAGTRELDDLLFRSPKATGSALPIRDYSDFQRTTWKPAATAAGLPEMVLKDLRAYSASVIVDAGGSRVDAQYLLRHTSATTTDRHYTRAMGSQPQDPHRAHLRIAQTVGQTLSERINALFEAWRIPFRAEAECVLNGGPSPVKRVKVAPRPKSKSKRKGTNAGVESQTPARAPSATPVEAPSSLTSAGRPRKYAASAPRPPGDQRKT